MTGKLTLIITLSSPLKEGEIIEIILTRTTGQVTSYTTYLGTIYEPVFEAGYAVAEVVEATEDWKRGAELELVFRPLFLNSGPGEWNIGTVSFTPENLFTTEYGTYSTLVEAVGLLLEKGLDGPPQQAFAKCSNNKAGNETSKVVICATKQLYELSYRDSVQIQWWQGQTLLDEATIIMTGLSISQQLGSEIYSTNASFWQKSNVKLYYQVKHTSTLSEQFIGSVELVEPNEPDYSAPGPDEVVAEVIQNFLYENLPD